MKITISTDEYAKLLLSTVKERLHFDDLSAENQQQVNEAILDGWNLRNTHNEEEFKNEILMLAVGHALNEFNPQLEILKMVLGTSDEQS